jgi:hypothetical protein
LIGVAAAVEAVGLEAVMARQPEVFVRALDPVEAQRLMKITRTTRDRVRLRRAGSCWPR